MPPLCIAPDTLILAHYFSPLYYDLFYCIAFYRDRGLYKPNLKLKAIDCADMKGVYVCKMIGGQLVGVVIPCRLLEVWPPCTLTTLY